MANIGQPALHVLGENDREATTLLEEHHDGEARVSCYAALS